MVFELVVVVFQVHAVAPPAQADRNDEGSGLRK